MFYLLHFRKLLYHFVVSENVGASVPLRRLILSHPRRSNLCHKIAGNGATFNIYRIDCAGLVHSLL